MESNPKLQTLENQAQIPADWSGRRLDQVLATLFPDFSRARLQAWLKSGQILLNDRSSKSSHRVVGGEKVTLNVTLSAETTARAEPIQLDVLFEDAHLLLLNKPAGLVVHPAVGHASGTLQNALLHHSPQIESVPRAGIVHRLDKLTSGVMVVAKTLPAHKSLVDQLQSRQMRREYQALVHGALVAGGTVDQPIGRHPRDRKKMAVVSGGKRAVTHFRTRQKFRDFTWLDVKLETGRTHQIRVHMAYQRHPLVGDPVYGVRFRPPAGADASFLETLAGFKRQALHAKTLTLEHPVTGATQSCSAPKPDDLVDLLAALGAEQSQAP